MLPFKRDAKEKLALLFLRQESVVLDSYISEFIRLETLPTQLCYWIMKVKLKS